MSGVKRQYFSDGPTKRKYEFVDRKPQNCKWVSPLAELPDGIHYPRECLVGRTFGRLTVESYAGWRQYPEQKQKDWYWWCKCSCGNPELVKRMGRNMVRGVTKSCGCLNREEAVNRVERNKEKPKVMDARIHNGRVCETPWDIAVRRASLKFLQAANRVYGSTYMLVEEVKV